MMLTAILIFIGCCLIVVSIIAGNDYREQRLERGLTGFCPKLLRESFLLALTSSWLYIYDKATSPIRHKRMSLH